MPSPQHALLRLLPRVDARLTVLTTALVVTQAAVAVGLVLALSAVIEAVPRASNARLFGWIGVLSGLFVLQHILVPTLDYVAGRLGRKTDGYLREQLMSALLKPVGIAHLENPEILNLRRQATGIGEGQFTPAGAVAGIFRNLGTWLTVLSLSVVLAVFSVPLALLVTGFLIVVRRLLVRQLTRNALHTVNSTEDLRRADYYRNLSLTAKGAQEIRLFGLAQWLVERFTAHWHLAMVEVWRDRRRRSGRPWTWSVPWGIVIFVVLALTAKAQVGGELTLPQLVLVVQAAIGASSVWLSQDDVQIAYGAAAVPALVTLQQRLDEPTPEPVRALINAPSGDIQLEQVGFHYPGGPPVLVDLSLTIPAGGILAVVGANGAGKTTLVKLLTRMYEPTSGRLTIGGVDLADLSVDAWRSRVGAVFQDFVRYKLTAGDNVGFGRLALAEDRTALAKAAAAAGADGVVDTLESGWDTVLSGEFPGGHDLSGGQWQRVAVARALLAVADGADVLILDEPTASLDVKGELELFDQILDVTQGVTTVLVSHRFSTVRRADLICVLADGAVAELGTHDELMIRAGRYAAMYRLQASRFTEPSDTH